MMLAKDGSPKVGHRKNTAFAAQRSVIDRLKRVEAVGGNASPPCGESSKAGRRHAEKDSARAARVPRPSPLRARRIGAVFPIKSVIKNKSITRPAAAESVHVSHATFDFFALCYDILI